MICFKDRLVFLALRNFKLKTIVNSIDRIVALTFFLQLALLP